MSYRVTAPLSGFVHDYQMTHDGEFVKRSPKSPTSRPSIDREALPTCPAVRFTKNRMVDLLHPWQVLWSICGGKKPDNPNELDSKYTIQGVSHLARSGMAFVLESPTVTFEDTNDNNHNNKQKQGVLKNGRHPPSSSNGHKRQKRSREVSAKHMRVGSIGDPLTGDSSDSRSRDLFGGAYLDLQQQEPSGTMVNRFDGDIRVVDHESGIVITMHGIMKTNSDLLENRLLSSFSIGGDSTMMSLLHMSPEASAQLSQQQRGGVKSPPTFNFERRRSLVPPDFFFTQINGAGCVRFDTLGRGNQGIVQKAVFTPRKLMVALKEVELMDPAKRSLVLREIASMYKIRSPYIVSFFGACVDINHDTDREVLLLALEYMNRGTLKMFVQTHGPLSEPMLRSVAFQTLQALKHLHSNKILHRDVKPSNILLNSVGDCKLGDFGTLAELDAPHYSAKSTMGTRMYFSPERVTQSSRGYSFPVDIWSFGLTLIYCATGQFPLPASYWSLLKVLSGPDPSPSVPEGKFSPLFRSFIEACMHKSPDRRANVSQLLQHPFITTPVCAVSAPLSQGNLPSIVGGSESKRLRARVEAQRPAPRAVRYVWALKKDGPWWKVNPTEYKPPLTCGSHEPQCDCYRLEVGKLTEFNARDIEDFENYMLGLLETYFRELDGEDAGGLTLKDNGERDLLASFDRFPLYVCAYVLQLHVHIPMPQPVGNDPLPPPQQLPPQHPVTSEGKCPYLHRGKEGAEEGEEEKEEGKESGETMMQLSWPKDISWVCCRDHPQQSEDEDNSPDMSSGGLSSRRANKNLSGPTTRTCSRRASLPEALTIPRRVVTLVDQLIERCVATELKGVWDLLQR